MEDVPWREDEKTSDTTVKSTTVQEIKFMHQVYLYGWYCTLTVLELLYFSISQKSHFRFLRKRTIFPSPYIFLPQLLHFLFPPNITNMHFKCTFFVLKSSNNIFLEILLLF